MENLIGLAYNKKDGHGGNAAAHRAEMREVAQELFKEERTQLLEEFEERMRAAQYAAYHQALSDVMRVIEYDIESVTRIGIEGCRDIFESKKAQKFISDHVMATIKKELMGKGFRP